MRKAATCAACAVLTVLLFGCSPDAANYDQQDAVKAERTEADSRQEALESVAEAVGLSVEDAESFSPQNRESGHYRSEYRLGAWKDSIGLHGTVGGISVDVVSYRDGIRVYADTETVDRKGIAEVIVAAAAELYPDLDPDVASAFVASAEAGEYLVASDLDERLNLYITGASGMIELA